MSQLNPPTGHRGARRHSARSGQDAGSLRGYLLLALLPAAVAVVLGVALAVFLLHSPRSLDSTRIAVIAAAVVTAIVLAAAAWQARAAARRVQDKVTALHDMSSRSQEELRELQAERHVARQAQLLARSRLPDGQRGQPLEVFVNIARQKNQGVGP